MTPTPIYTHFSNTHTQTCEKKILNKNDIQLETDQAYIVPEIIHKKRILENIEILS